MGSEMCIRDRYIPELRRLGLVDGKITWPDGTVKKGKLQYIPELKGMYLVDGKVTLPDGRVEEGRFQYSEESEKMVLVKPS